MATAAKKKNSTSKTSKSNGYVSVIYFHGMGNQRRYEEISRLVDSLDIYVNRAFRNRGEALGYLTKILPRLEVSNDDPKKILTYIRVIFKNRKNVTSPWLSTTSRFYEVYWAPVMSSSIPVKETVLWVFSNLKRPWSTLKSRWRERQRLRRSTLIKLMENPKTWPKGIVEGDFIKVVKLYNMFESPQAHRDYPKGTFVQFLAFLKDKYEKKPKTWKRLDRLITWWRKSYVFEEMKNNYFLVTIGLFLILIFSLALGLVFMGSQSFAALNVIPYLEEHGFKTLVGILKPGFDNSLSLLTALATAIGVTPFLTKSLSDVQQWSTYEETNEKYQKRKDVLKRGFDTLAHVLKDKNCKRVVIIGHSLGTAVAHDTLLEVARYNRAYNAADPFSGPLALEKIEHFITLASPIDKIHYFFESYKSDYHRYKRVVEDLRGDIGEPPFAKNHKPHIHWINYWDTGDVISGALQSPSNRKWVVNLKVDNVHTSNFFFPDPGASHSGYFINREVMADVFDVIFNRAYSYKTAPRIANRGLDYDSQKRGPGKIFPAQKFFLTLLILFPYALLTTFLSFFFAYKTPIFWASAISVGILGLIIVLGFISARIRGPRNPL